MSLPTVAVVGRPNVGKSTFVNRIVGRREAIVEEKPGVTRDRKVLEAEWNGRPFILIDTGGWMPSDDRTLEGKVSKQSERAIRDADLVILITDVTTGVTDDDDRVASMLRRAKRPTLLVVNKVDSDKRELDAWEFSGLGLGDPWPVSSMHGRGTGDMLDELVRRLPPEPDVEDEPAGRATLVGPDDADDVAESVAIVGRPNVGKSTLFNRIIGDDRSVVHDQPGTTRDTIDTVIETTEGRIRFIDTAGMRRKSRMDEGTEYYSLVRALQAIDRANCALLVIDATEGVTHQDQRLAERVDAAGSPIMLVLNKWEVLDAEARARVTAEMEDRLSFLGYAPVLKISALTGLGVHKLLPALGEAIEAYHRRIPTRQLNRVIQEAQERHPPPGSRIYYATQGATDPPTFTIFSSRTLTAPYVRYLERKIREGFELGPTPMKIRVRRRSE